MSFSLTQKVLIVTPQKHPKRYQIQSTPVQLLGSSSPAPPAAVRAATLRALATLCSVLEAIRQLEEGRGVEVRTVW